MGSDPRRATLATIALSAGVLVAGAALAPSSTADVAAAQATSATPATAAAQAEQPTTLYKPGQGVTVPRLLQDVKSRYTADAMRQRIQGIVKMSAVILENGEVGDVKVTKSLDAKFGLDEEAVKAVKKWRFEPGMKDGKPVRVEVEVEMSFSLKFDPKRN